MVTDAINEEAMRFNRQHPTSSAFVDPASQSRQPPKPFKTGYETLKNPTYIPDLQADAALWATGPSEPAVKSGKQQQESSGHRVSGSQSGNTSGAPAKKMMSLEEVEAAMRAQPKKAAPIATQGSQATQGSPIPAIAAQSQQSQPQARVQHSQQEHYSHPLTYAEQNQLRSLNKHGPGSTQYTENEPTLLASRRIPPEYNSLGAPNYNAHNSSMRPLSQARHGIQNAGHPSAQIPAQTSNIQYSAHVQSRFPLSNRPDASHVPLPVIYHPSQIMNLPEDERNAYLVEEAKRAKRNHKIFLLSKGNGLMTPQDKNFITRIQLQQLMTATGNATEQDPDGALSEDFYYQVYNQIENRPRQNPQQPLSNFAQTYLFRTGNRRGAMGRRQRGGDGHVQRMEQQVQRAVEAAKAKPKNKQLVIQGSLGKISFSNAKTPKPLLNIKRHDSHDTSNRPSSKKAPQATLSTSDRKAVLKNIEAVYTTLMAIEDHDRRAPQTSNDNSDPAATQAIAEWRQTFKDLNQQLWKDLRVTDPIMSDSANFHPFIAFLSYPKGKKAIPRIFNHIDENQRLTILTMIMVHLDVLDVIRLAQPQSNKSQPSSMALEQVDLFLQAVMPSLFAFVSEAQLAIVIGLLGLVIERANLQIVTRTRVGLEVLTMLLSRAAIVKATENPDDQTWDQWLNTYNHFFDLIEPQLANIFPAAVSAGQDQYIWQFLAATGSGANPEQQQRLVLAVKWVEHMPLVTMYTNNVLLGIVSWRRCSRAEPCRLRWLLKDVAMSISSCRLSAWM